MKPTMVMIFLFCMSFCFAQKMVVEDQDANVLMEVNDEGDVGSISLPQGATPAEVADKLYNENGVLQWNGSALIPPQAGNSGKVLSTDGEKTEWKTHNVPKANTVGGNQLCQITKNYAWYQNVRTVSLTAPGPGMVVVIVTGYARWESKGWDLLLASILRNSDPNESWDAENEFFRYLTLLTDYNCTDSSDQYASFSSHRTFSVGAGTHTFTFWANKYSSSAKVRVDDVNMTAMYFPTGTAIFTDSMSPAEAEDPKSFSNDRITSPPDRAR